MPTFWENVLRFPRFFISSVIGLVLIIFGPFLNLLRKPQTAIVFFYHFWWLDLVFRHYAKGYVEFRVMRMDNIHL